MAPSTVDQAAAVPSALAAFLRGVERRGAVFCEMQCGNREVADGALAAAMRAFRTHAASLPMSGWPQRFWALLVATPPLRRPAPAAHWPAGLELLERLDEIPRKALLLRLVAGLPESGAADVLGLEQGDYEQALARACPRDAGGQPDAAAWRRLAESLQQHLRDLPPERLTKLALLRETAIAPPTPAPVLPVPAATGVAHQDRGAEARRGNAAAGQGFGRGFWAFGVVMACALALAVTWEAGNDPGATSGRDASRSPDEVRIEVEALPESPVALRFDPATSLATHPDLALLLDPREAAIAAQADFLAWYVAGRAAGQEDDERDGRESSAGAAAAPDAPPPDDAGATPSAPAVVPTLAQQLHDWEALSADARREMRARRGAWLALAPGERAQLRAAAAALGAMDPARRAALREAFDALDARERWGWRLGASLGADYPALFSVLGYVEPGQRDLLLAALRGLDAQARADLALLSQRTPPQGQQALRDQLLAQPQVRRGAWLRARVGR